MYSNLIGKARNLVVEFHMRSSGNCVVGKINEVDEIFVEVFIWRNEKTGEFASDHATYSKAEQGEAGWTSDRVLINIADISIIA
jgi:hypothetical protein